MFSNGLLVLTRPLVRLRQSLQSVLQAASGCVENTLYVHLAPSASFQDHTQPVVSPSQDVSDLVLQIYSGASSFCSKLDIRVLLGNVHSARSSQIAPQTLSKPLNVILSDDVVETLHGESLAQYIKHNFCTGSVLPVQSLLDYGLTQSTDVIVKDCEQNNGLIKTYSHVCLGGTFDRLHTGHKILLTEACIRCNETLTIGVTDGPMTQSMFKVLNTEIQIGLSIFTERKFMLFKR